MAKLDLKLVDENFTADDKSPADDKVRAYCARGIREGKRRAQEDLAKTINAVAQASASTLKATHDQEINRLASTVSKAAHRDGMLWGILVGMACAIGLAFATWFILREVVITNTATQRVNYPNPPTLQDNSEPVPYERVNPREPGTAN